MPGIVRELASFEGRDLRVEMFTIGGCTMERHLEQADCRDLIERGGYDFVVLQDQSLHPALIGTPTTKGSPATWRRSSPTSAPTTRRSDPTSR